MLHKDIISLGETTAISQVCEFQDLVHVLGSFYSHTSAVQRPVTTTTQSNMHPVYSLF